MRRYLAVLAVAVALSASCKGKKPSIPAPKAGHTEPATREETARPERGNADFVRVAQITMPAVVYVYALKEEAKPTFLSLVRSRLPIWRAFGFWVFSHMVNTYRPATSGTGFLISKRGYILTNFHVVDGADRIIVKGKHAVGEPEEEAEQLGSDPMSDVALIKINADYRHTALRLGDSDKLKVGEWVAAIGNPFDVGKTFTAGVVSGLRREDIGILELEDFIQTDASINPGNSGGPLVDINGDVVGINSLIFSDASRVGFAVPINIAREILPNLVNGERIDRGMLGVSLQDLPPETARRLGLADGGVVVVAVHKASPAETAGILPGDVITGFNGSKVAHYYELKKSVVSLPAGMKVSIDIIRRGKHIKKEARLARLERKS